MPGHVARPHPPAPAADAVHGCGCLRQRPAPDAHRHWATLRRQRSLRHGIKRADRLLGNRHLQQEARSVYAALCRVTLARIAEPLILVDWSDLKQDQSLHLLRASLAVGGRSLTLYEEVHRQKRLGNRSVQTQFLRRLATLLPARAAQIIIADSGLRCRSTTESSVSAGAG